MGGGAWDTGAYHSSRSTRAASGVKDFAYTTTATQVHETLNPRRIADKPCKKLEARDSIEHSESNPVLVCFDVTGSNYARAIDAQERLPHLMDMLNKYLTDPQVAVAANDDVNYVGVNAVQISDFESDNRVDDHIRNIWLTRQGGGNDGESYDLILYAAARKVALDSMEKRGKKGYLFLYADEPIFSKVDKDEVQKVYGDTIERDIPIAEILEEARRNFNVFLIWPEGGYDHARKQFIDLVGEESVLILQHPNLICELIASTIGLYESKATPESVVTDLVAVGVSDNEARALARTTAHAAAALAPSCATKAARL
jgi:hypothetical protein